MKKPYEYVEFPEEYELVLKLGKSTYHLPISKNDYYVVKYGGLRLLSDEDANGLDDYFDYSINDRAITFSNDFLKLLDFDSHGEIVSVFYAK